MVQEGQGRKKQPSDLTDEPWALVAPMIPSAKQRPRGGRPRKVNMREVLHTLLSLNRSGCPWDRLPHAWLPKRPVYDSFRPWRDDGTGAKLVEVLRQRTRVAAGRAPTPSAAGMERQSVKTTEMGGPERGEEGGQKSTGRTRQLLVDTLGVLLAVLMTRAGRDDGGRPRSCAGTSPPTIVRVSSRFVRISRITITL